MGDYNGLSVGERGSKVVEFAVVVVVVSRTIAARSTSTSSWTIAASRAVLGGSLRGFGGCK